MSTYTVVWTAVDDPTVSSSTWTADSLIHAKQDAWDMMKSYSPGDSTAVITSDDGSTVILEG